MIKIISFFTIIFLYSHVTAQSNLRVDYNSLEKGNFRHYTLISNDSLSTWITNEMASNAEMNFLSGKEFYFFKLATENKIYYETNIFTKIVPVVDSSFNLKWELTGNSKKIMKYTCLEAKTSFRGRNYTAFFTEDIPINNGPWKFGGLPGLILEIKSDDSYIEYVVDTIQYLDNYTIDTKDFDKSKYRTWTEYTNDFRTAYDEYLLWVQTSEFTNLGSKTNILVETIEIIYPKIQTKGGYTIEHN